jgi:hypothetical protein
MEQRFYLMHQLSGASKKSQAKFRKFLVLSGNTLP